jgi:hypothetical protein
MHFLLLIRAIYPAHTILIDMITLGIFGEKTNYEAAYYAVFSNNESFSFSCLQIFFSGPYSSPETPLNLLLA